MAASSKPKKSAPAAKSSAAKGTHKPAKPASKPQAKPAPKSAAKPAPKPATKPAAKPAAAKPAAGKGSPSKPVAAKPAPAKPAPKSVAKGDAAKAAPAKPGTKPAVSAKAPAGKGAPAAASGAQAAAAAQAAANGKKGPKGITIVNPKQVRKAKPKVKLEMPKMDPLIRPGQKWKPLIASGPKAPPSPHGTWKVPGAESESEFKIDPKARLAKKDLERYREILLRKRAELLGDISTMEEEALRTNSGSLSSLPQHMAEQGSDTFDQSVSLDLAAVDRNLLREIDAALQRIEDGTYGVCMKTGKRISAERLAELPWAQYSIEAAREMERRPLVSTSSSSSSSSSASNSSDND